MLLTRSQNKTREKRLFSGLLSENDDNFLIPRAQTWGFKITFRVLISNVKPRNSCVFYTFEMDDAWMCAT